MVTRFFLSLAIAIFTITLFGCGGSSLPGLNAPTTFTLYSIDGRDFLDDNKPKTDEEFRGYPVLGKIEVTDRAKQKELTSALESGVANGGVMAKCFWPRHAIRVTADGRTVDYVICFECNRVHIYDNEKESGKPISSDPQSVFNKHLQEANVSLAPNAFDKK